MDYTSVYAKERLTGRDYFLATGDTSYVDLGNIQMMKFDYGIKRKPHLSARRGIVYKDRDDAYGAEPKWSITSDEWVTPLLPFLWLGTANANFAQSSGAGSTFNFTSKKGKAFDIGKYGLFTASLTTPASKVE